MELLFSKAVTLTVVYTILLAVPRHLILACQWRAMKRYVGLFSTAIGCSWIFFTLVVLLQQVLLPLPAVDDLVGVGGHPRGQGAEHVMGPPVRHGREEAAMYEVYEVLMSIYVFFLM